MLSAANLNALDEAGVGFIVGSRTTRAPGDLEAHFHWHGDAPADGQVTRHHHPQKRLEHLSCTVFSALLGCSGR